LKIPAKILLFLHRENGQDIFGLINPHLAPSSVLVFPARRPGAPPDRVTSERNDIRIIASMRYLEHEIIIKLVVSE